MLLKLRLPQNSNPIAPTIFPRKQLTVSALTVAGEVFPGALDEIAQELNSRAES
jgi:hypothetical protein